MSTAPVVVRIVPGKATRGTSNGNARGSAEDRRRRREWLVETYRADVIGIRYEYGPGGPTIDVGKTETIWPSAGGFDLVWARKHEIARVHGYLLNIRRVYACRCYRCGRLLTVDTVTVDRIVPGCKGGTYRRNNIRPACGPCNSETGGGLASRRSR